MRPLSSIALILAMSQLPLVADELELTEGGILHGAIRSISPDGVITADLDIADQPASLHADKVTRVRFGKTTRKSDHDTMLTLVNGDQMPCDLTAISDKQITISTSYAGSLTIPRTVVRTVQLGIRPRKTIYRGPENLKHWKVDDKWHFEEDSMVSDGRGSISRDFSELPESFSLSFRLNWAAKPTFKIYFSSESATVSGGKHDRYYLQVGTAGIEIKRQSSGKNSYHSLITVNRSPENFANQEAKFEIRFDHRQRRLILYIDDQLEGEAADPLSVVPQGKFVILQSDDSNAEAHRVSEIVLREWDAAGERHRSEDRGDFGEDSLINNKGERFGGRLIASKGDTRDMILLFKSPLAPDSLNIPAAEVSTLFFKNTDVEESATTPLVLGLIGSGSIAASACTFGPDQVDLTHPLLGPMKLSRDSVKLLQRRAWPEDQEFNNDPDTEE